MGVDNKMAVNGSEFVDQPFNTSYGPWTDLFGSILGNGNVFFLVPVIVLTYGVYLKTESPIMASLFMITSGSLLGSGSIFVGAHDLAIAFTVFTAFGFVALFASILFMKK